MHLVDFVDFMFFYMKNDFTINTRHDHKIIYQPKPNLFSDLSAHSAFVAQSLVQIYSVMLKTTINQFITIVRDIRQ